MVHKGDETMTKGVVLITGASSGIGKATALMLAKEGYRVFAGARRVEKMEAMRAANIEPIALDVTDGESVAEAVRTIMERAGRLDILVNNAGYGLYGILEEVPHEEAQRQFDVNVFGLMTMTRAVLPVMRAQGGGRIINISSVAGKFVTPVSGWYAASKHAVEALSDALRIEVAPFGVKVVLIEPGAIRTEFEDTAVQQLESTRQMDVYSQMATKFKTLVQNNYRNAPGADVVAKTIVRAVHAANPRARYAFPMDSRMLILVRRLAGDRMIDRLLNRMFVG
jgi:NADP-dependent 3-hydroxy acid dehydrogenase YdfG